MPSVETFESGTIEIFEKPTHHCGVAAVSLDPESRARSVDVVAGMLSHLQNRGPDGAGVAAMSAQVEGYGSGYSDVGPVLQVLSPRNLSGLPDGEYAIGQTRYPTQGKSGKDGRNALQPISKRKFWMAQNGQFNYLEGIDGHPSDTYKAASELEARMTGGLALECALVDVVESVPNSAYCLTLMDKDGVLGVRDPRGIHPLSYGYSGYVGGFLIASETPALTNMGVANPITVPPGYMVKLVSGEEPKLAKFVENPLTSPNLCMLEAIYFARADGELEGKSIYEISKNAGRILAIKDDILGDIVVPVPDSARAAAQGYAEYTWVPYTEGFVRVGSARTFLQNSQEDRVRAVNHKLNIIPSQVKDKRIILVEDSIVRGTTLQDLVRRLKQFGALEVHVRIASPMVKSTCEYGINIPTKEELLANRCNGSVDEMRKEIGADSLMFLTVPESRRAIGGALGRSACMKCFTGRAPVDDFKYCYPNFN